MRVIYDIADRYQQLAAMEDDVFVINEDGSRVNAYLELAAECYEVPKADVTVEMRDAMIPIVRRAVEKALQVDALQAKWGKAPWSGKI